MHYTYIFDLDGTLVDSMPYFSNMIIELLKKYNVKYPKNLIEILTPLGYQGMADYIVDELGLEMTTEELLKLMMEQLLINYRDEIPLKSGVYEYLEKCIENGIKIYVLTASMHKFLDPCLKRLGVYDMFSGVWSCDDFGSSKSEPAIYYQVAGKIGVEPGDIVFFDDNINAITAASDAGVYSVGVYDISGIDFKERLINIADGYVETFLSSELY